MKYVYLIQNLEDGKFKIGVSKNPDVRLKSVQTGNGSELKLFDKYPSEIPYKVETALHNFHSYCRKKGEWFEMPLTEAFKFQEKCKKIEENILFLKQNNNVFI